MLLGLKRGTVELRPSSAQYPALFEEERVRVQQALGGLALDIQHVGSTSIPGLWTKPILDLAVAVHSTLKMEVCTDPLHHLGYAAFGDREGWGESFFARGTDEARTHYLHLMPLGHPRWRDSLSFRDVLRRRPDLRGEYQRLKTALAQSYPEDRRAYTAQKGAFVLRVLADTSR